MDSSLRSVAEQLLKDLQRTYSETNQNCDLCLALVLFRRWTWWTSTVSHVCHLPAVERLFRTPPTITCLSPAFSTSPSVLLVSRECLCVWSAPDDEEQTRHCFCLPSTIPGKTRQVSVPRSPLPRIIAAITYLHSACHLWLFSKHYLYSTCVSVPFCL
ncbi:zinc finger SWIM domain-containing protein 7 isoform X1 [Chanodichthys erythropterus]|uniref:zinc finger SWIM domain-containing protein 7 isoform X1 n=1 Tax=Chanodichthys erythropterus TaxID=933992 RepID=UPI00351F4084